MLNPIKGTPVDDVILWALLAGIGGLAAVAVTLAIFIALRHYEWPAALGLLVAALPAWGLFVVLFMRFGAVVERFSDRLAP